VNFFFEIKQINNDQSMSFLDAHPFFLAVKKLMLNYGLYLCEPHGRYFVMEVMEKGVTSAIFMVAKVFNFFAHFYVYFFISLLTTFCLKVFVMLPIYVVICILFWNVTTAVCLEEICTCGNTKAKHLDSCAVSEKIWYWTSIQAWQFSAIWIWWLSHKPTQIDRTCVCKFLLSFWNVTCSCL